jgi:hypothetical protein
VEGPLFQRQRQGDPPLDHAARLSCAEALNGVMESLSGVVDHDVPAVAPSAIVSLSDLCTCLLSENVIYYLHIHIYEEVASYGHIE